MATPIPGRLATPSLDCFGHFAFFARRVRILLNLFFFSRANKSHDDSSVSQTQIASMEAMRKFVMGLATKTSVICHVHHVSSFSAALLDRSDSSNGLNVGKKNDHDLSVQRPSRSAHIHRSCQGHESTRVLIV